MADEKIERFLLVRAAALANSASRALRGAGIVVVTVTPSEDGSCTDFAMGSEACNPIELEGAIRAIANSAAIDVKGNGCDCVHCAALVKRLETIIAVAQGDDAQINKGAMH